MHRLALSILLLLATAPAMAEVDGDATPRDTIAQRYTIREVEIAARRPLRDIGVQRTQLDSALLRETISSSLADALASGSTAFIKSYGRATLATASFRGTAPSHTQVTWNGMKVNSPMLGQVDFSMIPSYFIDEATLYHGASSIGVAGGGLGGAVTLAAKAPTQEGFGMRYVQGIGSFKSFDEFLHLTYRGDRWSSSTRFLCSTSENDFRYHNYASKQFDVDDDGNIIGRSTPLERNRNGGFQDIHVMQELYHTLRGGDRLSIAAWYLNSHRGLPMTSSDRNSERQKKESQDEQTLRAVAGWERLSGGLRLNARGGYTYTSLRYLRQQDPEGQGEMRTMTDARSILHSIFVTAEAEYALRNRWIFTANITAYQHLVRTGDVNVDSRTGLQADTLYTQQRFELSAFAAVKWRPTPRLGIAANLRWELWGQRLSSPIPALFIDYLLSPRGEVTIKASAARNYRYPTLNDLYFRPGGNPSLRPEQGWTADAGVEAAHRGKQATIRGSVTAFWSDIDDWILWIGSAKSGIYTPLNVKHVRSYGVEAKYFSEWRITSKWRLGLDGNAAWTRSINRGEPFSPADQSIGKQLPYIPIWSAALTARVAWRGWTMSYKWSWYSRRYTMSDNAKGVLGAVEPYLMSDLSLERALTLRWATISLKGCINNLLNEEYESVLGRPMPRLNASFYIGITPRFRR